LAIFQNQLSPQGMLQAIAFQSDIPAFAYWT